VTSPAPVVRTALRLLRRHAGVVYGASAAATLVNTVPDVLRQVLVWDDPRVGSAILVDVIGFLTGLVAQLWLTGAVAGLPAGEGLTPRGGLRRGTALARRAVVRAPRTVLAGVVLGGGVSALVTLPASIAAHGLGRVLGPLDSPPVGGFAVATVSDAVASWLTLPFLALVLVLAAGRSVAPEHDAGSRQPRSGH
jgi:hypothetical protein